MKVIDAHTGIEVGVVSRVPLPKPPGRPAPYYEVLAILPGIWRASMDARVVENGRSRIERNVPLTVRWTHPGFFLQHVAFVES